MDASHLSHRAWTHRGGEKGAKKIQKHRPGRLSITFLAFARSKAANENASSCASGVLDQAPALWRRILRVRKLEAAGLHMLKLTEPSAGNGHGPFVQVTPHGF